MWKQWLSRLEGAPGESHPPQDIALAVLLLECARADFAHAPAEVDAVREALAAQLHLPVVEIDRLIERAQGTSQVAVSLHGPIARLNRELSAEAKRDLMGWLWQVACADGRIDLHEEHLLRKLADLMHIPHADFIRTKLTALERPPA